MLLMVAAGAQPRPSSGSPGDTVIAPANGAPANHCDSGGGGGGDGAEPGSTNRTNLIKLKSLLLTWIPFVRSAEPPPPPPSGPPQASRQRAGLLQVARGLFGGRRASAAAPTATDLEPPKQVAPRSAPATPLRWQNTASASPCKPSQAPGKLSPSKVRFRTGSREVPQQGQEDEAKLDPQEGEEEEQEEQSPMDSAHFRRHGYKLVDYICDYLDTIGERRVTPLNIEPGYLKQLIQTVAPERGEPFGRIMRDFESHIMCGITHWQHPHFHAYFPAGNAYPSILADMLSDALGCVGFSWAASPAYTELEIIMLDWMGKMIGLPDEFLCLSGPQNSKGGGVIQGSASECVLVNLLAARHWAIEALRKKYPDTPDPVLLGKLIGYCSREAHSCVEKAAMIGFIRMRALETDERNSLRGDTLARAMEADIAQGLEPFIVCATLGTTSCCSFDNLEELGRVCQERQVWLHVDAAYAGSAFICPEFKYLMRGIEMATSFNMNPNKWLLINFDCSLMWVKDRFKLTRAFVVDPLYLQHSFSDQAIDYRHWGIPLSRRFRSLKIWFTIRNYGVQGLQAYIRNHVRLAKMFAELVGADARFQITNQVELGLVCFRLVGSNALNQRLLSMINASGKLHMVPASLKGRYVIRFCVCDQRARDQDIRYAYECISQFATDLFESIRAGRERIRAISQQNTIDVSSLSLHRQQSTSADKLCSDLQQQMQQLEGSQTGSQASNRCGGAKSPLTKQATVQPATLDEISEPVQQEAAATGDSLASLDALDYELDAELAADLLSGEPDERVGGELTDPLEARSPIARRAAAAAAAAAGALSAGGGSTEARHEQEEAQDEVLHLAERRNRMSLRYKREFFVRVVSDPRVYRASISGDINAHASCSSLGGSSSQQVASTGGHRTPGSAGTATGRSAAAAPE